MPSNPKVIEFIQKKVRDVLVDTTVLIKDNIGSGNFGVVNGTGIEYFIDESGHSVGLIPKRITETKTFWLSINVAINTSTNKLKDVSIGVYSDEPRVKLFRAEWAHNLSSIAHAQPHWHVHNVNISTNNSAWSDDEQKDFSLEFEQSDKQIFDIKDIHFAMYASWHRSENNHIEILSQFSDTDIVNWTAGTLKYIIEQLIYLYNKKQLYN